MTEITGRRGVGFFWNQNIPAVFLRQKSIHFVFRIDLRREYVVAYQIMQSTAFFAEECKIYGFSGRILRAIRIRGREVVHF